MKKFKLGRLNRKGFTLIELLAVIVILAVVMGIAANSVLNSINQSRRSSLLSVAQNAANTLNTWVAEDMLLTDNTKKHLGDTWISKSQSGSWICLNTADIEKIQNAQASGTLTTKLIDALSLSANDFTFSTTAALTHNNATSEPSCSALRYNKSTAGYEILLVAKSGGKYFVSSDPTHYAYSRANAANAKPAD